MNHRVPVNNTYLIYLFPVYQCPVVLTVLLLGSDGSLKYRAQGLACGQGVGQCLGSGSRSPRCFLHCTEQSVRYFSRGPWPEWKRRRGHSMSEDRLLCSVPQLAPSPVPLNLPPRCSESRMVLALQYWTLYCVYIRSGDHRACCPLASSGSRDCCHFSSTLEILECNRGPLGGGLDCNCSRRAPPQSVLVVDSWLF